MFAIDEVTAVLAAVSLRKASGSVTFMEISPSTRPTSTVVVMVVAVMVVAIVVVVLLSSTTPVIRPKGSTSPSVVTGETIRRTELTPVGISHFTVRE